MTVAASIPVARRDGTRGERAPVIAAHEREDEVLAGGVTDDLERILDRLRAADIEVHAASLTELRLVQTADGRGQLYALRMEVLRGQLWQLVELTRQRVVQALVAIAETR